MNLFSYKDNKILSYIFLFFIFFRFILIFSINKVPCMDPLYFEIGKTIFNGFYLQEPFAKNYASPAGYGYIYFILKNFIFRDYFLTSAFIYIFSSITCFIGLYKYCVLSINKDTAIITLLLFLTTPFLSIAPAGYSHTYLFATSIFIWVIYLIEILNIKKNSIYLTILFFLLFLLSQIRFEVFFLIIFYVLFNSITNKKIYIYYYFFFCLILLINYLIYINIIQQTEFASMSGDKRWVYKIWTHTLSFRFLGYYDPIWSIEKSKEIFGTPIKNNYSIISAIFNNKIEFIKNILFNFKQMIFYISHPLSMPIFNWIFLGYIFAARSDQLIKVIKFFALFIIFTIPNIIFHTEIRYLAISNLFVIILLGWSLKILNIKLVTYFVLISNFLISIVYSIQYLNIESLCG